MTVINVETKYFPSSRPSSPAVVVQVTCLADSYMVWVGVTEEPEEKAGSATLQGYLGKDWVVAMPPWKVRAHRMENWLAPICSPSEFTSHGNSVVAVLKFGRGTFDSN